MSVVQEFRAWWRRRTAPARMLPGCAFPVLGGLQEGDIAQAVEILDDPRTPLRFVEQVLQAELGLARGDALLAAALAHGHGGVLIPVIDAATAATAASALTEAARKAGWPLRCRAVALDGVRS